MEKAREFPGARTIETLLKNHSLNRWSEAKTPKRVDHMVQPTTSGSFGDPRYPRIQNPSLVCLGGRGVSMHCPNPIARPMATHSTKLALSELYGMGPNLKTTSPKELSNTGISSISVPFRELRGEMIRKHNEMVSRACCSMFVVHSSPFDNKSTHFHTCSTP